jgi:hypothetical protein
VTFAKGASLKDPSRLFNASLEGNARRAIDVHDGEKIDGNTLAAKTDRRRRTEDEDERRQTRMIVTIWYEL